VSLVTVCIPAYQAAEFIDRTLDCARGQTHRELRILVSVDVSTDDTAEVCRRHAAGDDRVEVVEQSERLGWAGNVNFLLGAADSEFAFVYFHDDLIDERYCEALVAALHGRPDAASAHCDMGHFGGSDRVMPGRTYDGPAARRLLEFLISLRRPSLLRSMLRTEKAGNLRLPADAGGVWANQPFLAKLLVAGPCLHVPEILYRRWEQREGGLTEGWRRLPFDRILDGYRLNAEETMRTIESLEPGAEERELLQFGLFVHMTARLRRAESRYGVSVVHPPESLLPQFAGMAIPPAVDRLPAELSSRCVEAYDRLQRRTGKHALEVRDHAAAAAAYEDLAARHPGNRAFWRQLAKALAGLGRSEEAEDARQRARALKPDRTRA
jgi:hypothetical protein